MSEERAGELWNRLVGRIVGLDSMVLIYWLADDERYAPLVAPLFRAWREQGGRVVTSTLAVTETLVGPYRLGESDDAERARLYLTSLPFLTFEPVTIEIADRAAELRGRRGLRTPDAIHAATALAAGAEAFLTNDRAFDRIEELNAVQLDDWRG